MTMGHFDSPAHHIHFVLLSHGIPVVVVDRLRVAGECEVLDKIESQQPPHPTSGKNSGAVLPTRGTMM